MQKTQDNPQGGIVEKEAPIAISNLKVSSNRSREWNRNFGGRVQWPQH